MRKELPDTQSFIAILEEQFEDILPGSLQPGTIFRELPQWNSLQALVIVSSLNWNFGVALSAQELRNSNTIHDLFQLVSQKMHE